MLDHKLLYWVSHDIDLEQPNCGGVEITPFDV